jgi:hypothetical protein
MSDELTLRLTGSWRITQMDLWDLDDIELEGPASIEFDANEKGRFHFITVHGWMDCRHEIVEGRPRVDFSWEGVDEGDSVTGRGWATLEPDGALRGHLYFHLGDDSGFRAIRAPGGRSSPIE